MKTHTPLVIANWKMNPQSVTVAGTLLRNVQKEVSRIKNVEVVVAPPHIYMSDMARIAKGKRVALAAQNVFWEGLGARTGETSPLMLKSFGVTHVIIGHSERRALGESNSDVSKKVTAVLKAGYTVVLCVGELERDSHGHFLGGIEEQVRSALKGVPKAKLGNVVIAYEPVWAIGTGKTALPHDAYEMKLFIQKILSDVYGRPSLTKVRIIYGGSVNKANAQELLTQGAVDGFLVGGASLRASEFGSIVNSAGAEYAG